MSKLSSSKFCRSTQSSADALLLLCCKSSRKCHHAAQTTPTWTKPILTCFTKLIAVQPSMAEYEWTMYQIKVDYLCDHALKSVLLYLFFLQFLEIWSQIRVSFYATQSSYLVTQNLEKSNFDMFYKNYCWAVICYPICMTNVSYERGLIVSTIIPWY